jgi:MinD superfamily P-loop ATPase
VELVVLSGKGGTGKTSVVGSLAAMAENKILVDCDVDAANLHLILEAEVEQREEFSAGAKAEIDIDKCGACGTCELYCRFEAIKYEEDLSRLPGTRWWVDPYACEGCGVCRHFCPDQAISFNPVQSGEWYISKTRYGPLIHARLGVAESNSGKLVSLIRSTAKSMANAEKRNLIITDGPPGIGCPVIAAMTGADFVLAVTEPSKSALHDLNRIIALARNLRISVGLCINKYDISHDLTCAIEKFAADQGIPVLGKIPYDPMITQAQIEGRPFLGRAEVNTNQAVRSLWDGIRERCRFNHVRTSLEKSIRISENNPNAGDSCR